VSLLNRALKIGLLTGGIDKPYALGLAMALVAEGIHIDFIGSDAIDSPCLYASPHVTVLKLRGDQREDASLVTKAIRILTYYWRLLRYAAASDARIFHVLWNNRFELLDRTALLFYYKAFGKSVILTAHNVNTRRRDGRDSRLNRLTLRIQYRLADHIFVHTDASRDELTTHFGVQPRAVTVIPFPINNVVPETGLTREAAKRRLGIGRGDRSILFFGRIGPYKGLEYLVAAVERLIQRDSRYRLIIAGTPKRGAEDYLRGIQNAIDAGPAAGHVIRRIEHIPDEAVEQYFKAADLLALPYTDVCQSGVLFLGYRFGLPVVAADVGSFHEDVVEGRTGFICRPRDAEDLADAIARYFASDLYAHLDSRRADVQGYAHARHSWDGVARTTVRVYAELLGASLAR
jgi:glycosyltransferase involved in cell wall biosynthesis